MHSFHKKSLIVISLCIILLLSNCFIYVQFAVENTQYVWCNQSKPVESKETSAGLISDSATVTDNPLNLDCESACLIEQSSGLIIYDHNMHEKLRPASVTKIMSLLLIMEALDSGIIHTKCLSFFIHLSNKGFLTSFQIICHGNNTIICRHNTNSF